MRRAGLAFLLVVPLLAALFAVRAETPTGGEKLAPMATDSETADKALLEENKVPTKGPELLEFFRKRYLEGATEEKIKRLIEQLGDDEFEKRQAASGQLVLIGQRAIKHLQEALRHADLEIRHRAKKCLAQISSDGGLATGISAAAVRLLAKQKPEGVVRVLFSSLPRLDDESLTEEVRQALTRLALKDGKPHPVLVAGLKDKLAVKRAAAAVALCKVKATEQMPAIRKLLEDPEQPVRVRVALAMVQMRHKEAMPVLLALMDQPVTREIAPVEDLLFRLAGDKSPTLDGSDESARTKYRRAWESWWKDNGGKINLAVLEEEAKFLGHTTVVMLDTNQVLDLDAGNRVRWKIDGVEMPLDIQRLSGERVLLAEYKGNRVTERNNKGEVIWQHKITEPLVAQRLANGNTFMANRSGLVEVDKTGKEVFTYNRPAGEEIMRARKLPGGDIVMIAQLGVARFVRIDRFGKEVKSFGVEVATSGGRIDVLPNGHVLIPELHHHRVVERDMEGKQVREIAIQQPIAAVALPNGNVVITSMSQKRAVEIDRAGKEVWEYKRDTRVTRAVRH
jgi:F0F1-type ATP synthase epsilon subunit